MTKMSKLKKIWINLGVLFLVQSIALIAVLNSCKTKQDTVSESPVPVAPPDTVVKTVPVKNDSVADDTVIIKKTDTINPKYKPIEPICLYGVQPVIEID